MLRWTARLRIGQFWTNALSSSMFSFYRLPLNGPTKWTATSRCTRTTWWPCTKTPTVYPTCLSLPWLVLSFSPSPTDCPWSHGVMDRGIDCEARGPGFDPSFILILFSSLGSKVVKLAWSSDSQTNVEKKKTNPSPVFSVSARSGSKKIAWNGLAI